MRIEELLILLFILFPLLQRFFGRKQEEPEAPEHEPIDHLDGPYRGEAYREEAYREEGYREEAYREPVTEPVREPVASKAPSPEVDPFAEALRQIREAFEEPKAASKPAPPPEPVFHPMPGPEPSLERSTAPRREPIRPPRPVPSPAAMSGGTESVKSQEIKGTSAIRSGSLTEPDAPRRTSELDELVRSLRTEKGAREAFVMREILDRPKSMRRR